MLLEKQEAEKRRTSASSLGDGDIAVSDVTLDQMTNENVLGWIGYVPQEHILFSKQRGKIFYSEGKLEKAIEIAAFKKT